MEEVIKFRKTITTNSTWDKKTKRTYTPLIVGVYYRPENVYLEYYSDYFGKTYYDGYGWNFYTQKGEYYDGRAKDDESTKIIIVVTVIIIVLCICFCAIYAFSHNKDTNEQDEIGDNPEIEFDQIATQS